jgi:CPA2 family monovalent cation:H+ antiporter-2
MPHHDSLVAIAIVGLAALLCGMAMTRLRQPALVGYILAGVLLGPSALGLVVDRDLISLFAEIGVLMLLFLIGMELPLASFLKVWRIALACMALQIVGALCFAFLLSGLMGWTREAAIVAGFVMALSSTAVAIKILEAIGEMESDTGRLTIAVLIAQDLAVVPMMLIVRDLSRDGFSLLGLVQVALAVAFLVVFLVFLDKRGGIRLPIVERIAGNPDLRAIAALALCLGAAAASGLLGLSPAYGAFLAGILIGNTEQSKAMIHSTQPIQSLFMMVFFLSVGLLIDLGFIWEHLGQVLAWLVLVTLFKTALNIAALHVIGNPWDRSFLAGVVMGQIGEFSFVLVATAAAAGLIAPDGYRLTVAVIALSLMISPLWLAVARRLVPIMALSLTSFREIVRLLLGQETIEMAARSRLAALTAAKAAADRLRAMRGNGGSGNGAPAGASPATYGSQPAPQTDSAAANAAAAADTQMSSPIGPHDPQDFVERRGSQDFATPGDSWEPEAGGHPQSSPEPSTTNVPEPAPPPDPSLPANENRSKTGG